MIEKLKLTTKLYFSYVLRYQWSTLKDISKESMKKIMDSGFEPLNLKNTLLFSDYKENPKKRLEGIIGEYEDTIYVLFMATNSFHDWLTNFFFFKKKVPYNNVDPRIMVHSGYLNRYQLNSIRTVILLNIAKRTNKKVIVSGYSMGGGLAPICAVDIGINFPAKEVTCFSLAGPKVGNKQFIDSLDYYIDSYHFSCSNDPVVKVPPKIFGFRHIKERIHFGEKVKWWKLNWRDHLPHKMFFHIFK